MQIYNFLKNYLFFPALISLFISACDSSKVKDAIEIGEGVPRKRIDTNILGTNAFVNDSRFGTINSQFREVKNTLRLNFVRILFKWDDNVQPTPGSAPNFSFYDNIASSIPAGMDAIVVITGIPSWMRNSANWIGGDPRRTFVELWVKKVVARYRGNGRIIGWQVWNEPNMVANQNNITMQMAENPENYVELLRMSFSAIRSIAPSKLVINAATTAINQNYPGTIDYNKNMQSAGVLDFCDVYAVHYYGRQFENVVRRGGVASFLNGLGKDIWVTESGAQGVNEQLPYGEQVWPYLKEKIPSIQRIYQYQFAEATPADSTYALRNLTKGMELSDLYIFLRDR